MIGTHIITLDQGSPWPTAISPKTVRVADAHWYDVEKVQNVYDWTVFDAIFNKIPADVEAIAVHNGSPTCWSTRPTEVYTGAYAFMPPGSKAPPDLAALSRFETAYVKRYKQIKFVEGQNEPNAFFTGTIPELVEVQRALRIAALTGNPAIKMISPSWVVRDSAMADIEQFLRTTGAYDIGWTSIASGGINSAMTIPNSGSRAMPSWRRHSIGWPHE